MVLRKLDRKKSTPSFGSMLDRWNLPFPVRDYQKLGVEFFLSNRAALLADDMGLGKTVQTILAVRLFRSIKPGARILIVTPRSLSRNWLQEFSTWAPDILVRQVEGGGDNRRAYYNLPLPVLLATYEQVRIDSDLLNRESRFDVVILDEAQRIKESSSSTSIACRGIPRSRSWALSGTPVENKSDDIIALFSFLDRTLLYKGISRIELHKRIKPHFLRRTKASVASDMPEIINQNLELELGTLQKSAYDRTWESRHNLSLKKGRSPTTAHMLALLTKLKQLCNYDPDVIPEIRAA
ncbi:MAG: DEAD/DEAH box helicase [Planctomycetes bacterium]|nr:DEAD/DEAH box helicase [Planctomycetota bacterium]